MATSRISNGMGTGTPEQELLRWIREAGRITVHEEGEQHQLFESTPVKMLRLYSRAGDSILVTAQWAAQFGIHARLNSANDTQPTQPVFGESQAELF